MRNGSLVYNQPLRDPNAAPIPSMCLIFECPGCGGYHRVPVGGDSAWEWNGSLESATLWPSIKVNGHNFCCHFFITSGEIKFEHDCTHKLANKTVPLPEVSRG
jgi:hypothetical protein